MESTPLGSCIGLFLKHFFSNFRSHIRGSKFGRECIFNAAQPGVGRVQVLGSKKLLLLLQQKELFNIWHQMYEFWLSPSWFLVCLYPDGGSLDRGSPDGGPKTCGSLTGGWFPDRGYTDLSLSMNFKASLRLFLDWWLCSYNSILSITLPTGWAAFSDQSWSLVLFR